MGTEEAITAIKANRIGIVFAITIATLVAFAPSAIVLGRMQWLAIFTALAGLTSSLTLRRFATTSTEKPSSLEFVLAGLGVLCSMAFAALVWLGWDWGIYKISKLLRATHPESIAFWCSVPLAIIFILVFSNGKETAKYLYSETAGLKSAYHAWIARRRPFLITYASVVVAILVVVSTLVIATGHLNKWFYIFLEVYLFMVGAAALPGQEVSTRPGVDLDAIEKVAKVFEAAGYAIEKFPRTRKSEVDPLLISLDLLARKDEDWIAIQVKTRMESSEPVDWRILSASRTAAWTLGDARSLPPRSVKSMLILLDMRLDRSFKSAMQRESSLVVSLTRDELSDLTAEGVTRARQEEAVLRWTSAPDTSARPSPVGRARGRERHA